ncbi:MULTISPECIES: GntP family permease [Gammaproteobacteria]|uniref:GntP family permease n=1 Tax=Gammaproteobacteria TaxID=1236 RepID=UPI000DD0D00D|nr:MULTISPECIES: GntP family permease [Gammaproteobacteria]RTE85481.1 GntP family permease [Aliidiomarina sp. B3213]TCZ89449.1 GntP family permease [Lysobacter sp. N42]
MLGNLGLVVGLALLIGLALRGMNILLAVLISVGVIGLTNAMSFNDIYLQYFPFGASGAFSFAGNFLLLFLCGAIFGRIMAASRAAQSVAVTVTQWLGAERALWVAMLVCAVLTYGGVVVFVVMFTMYPIGVTLMKEANIPRRLYAAAIALGAGTFTMTAMPGTPSIHNVIGARSLGTDLFAGAAVGLVASAVMIGLGMWYLQWRWKVATQQGEGYQATDKDEQMRKLAETDKAIVPWGLAILPIIVVLGSILVPRLLMMASIESSWIGFANTNPILWASFALLLGAFTCFVLFPDVRKVFSVAAGEGANDAIMPLINTAAVIGFGGVVIQTPGFSAFAEWLLGLPLEPLVSVFISANLISGITASASGGLQIFMSSLAESYLAAGVSPEMLHRIANLAAGGLDSLPHSGAVIALFTLMGLTHKEAYKDVFVVTVIIPMIAALVAVALALFLY